MQFGKRTTTKQNRKVYGIGTAVVLLVIFTLVFTALSSSFFLSAAIAADLHIDMTARSSGNPPQGELAGQYETVYTTEKNVELLQSSIFKDQYKNTQQQVTVAGTNGEKVIAPGTENTYKFAVINTYSGYLDYKITVDAEVKGLKNHPDKHLPVEVRLKGAQEWLLGSDEGTDAAQWQAIAALDNIEESAVLRGRGNNVYTLDWRWKFEQDDVARGDALDTWLGTQAEPVTLTITITTQAAYHAPSQPAILAPIPKILEKIDHIGYLFGYEDGTVRPQASITRAEVAAILCRLLEEDVRDQYTTNVHGYSDIPEDAWYRTSVATLSRMKLFGGYPDGTFRGNQTITRAELAAVLARVCDWEDAQKVYKTNFNDVKGHWAENDIKRIESYNWIQGYGDGTFRPERYITRAETVAMFNRVVHRTPERHENLMDGKSFMDNLDKDMWYYVDIQEAANGHDYARLTGTREAWTKVWENNVKPAV